MYMTHFRAIEIVQDTLFSCQIQKMIKISSISRICPPKRVIFHQF